MMKKLFGSLAAITLAVVAGLSLNAVAGGSFSKSNCTFNGKKLYGKIQVVTAFPDVKVQVVNAFPDVKVEKVNAFPDKCGKWQMVTAFPDTKVQFVTAFPDVKIKYVTAFPGVD
ncbi:MAG TPA: hypothetical protein VGE37_03615 [Archangium sp.]